MTLVSRITLSFLAVITMFTADAEGQIFRRLRDNVRPSYAPQGQRGPVRVAPQPQRPYGQSLTPYSRLTPQQRSASGQANTRNPNAASEKVNVRVVTYYDPRTGRTFQRRVLVPANQGTADQAGRRQLAGAKSPTADGAVPKKPAYDKIPKPAVVNRPQQPAARSNKNIAQQPKFNIPPIAADKAPANLQRQPITEQPLPVLAGPQSVVAPATATTATTISVAPPTRTAPPEVTPTIQAPGLPLEPAPKAGLTANVVDAAGEIVIDASVEPAAVTSDTITVGTPISQDTPPVAYSVLEVYEDSQENDAEPTTASEPASSDFDIEISSADEIEAFFDQ